MAESRRYMPELLITAVPADVALALLDRAGLEKWRVQHRGEDPRVDRVLIDLRVAAMRWREMVAGNGRNRAPIADSDAPSEWLTTAQAGERLGLAARTVRRYIASGDLPAERAGHMYLIHPDHLNRGRYTA